MTTSTPECKPETARQHAARALWYVAPGRVELRPERLADPKPDEVLVRAEWSGISRGTERLVLSGSIDPSEWERMRAPLQAGAFPFPVKYGYCATGRVLDGPADLVDRRVFVLHPHQDLFLCPASMAVPLPEVVPSRRATLAANMETALNALWDSGAAPADRIAVVGGGIVGLLVAYLAGRLPGADVTLVDVASERAPLAAALGVRFAHPSEAPAECDIVFHTSVTAGGLATAIGAAGLEATIVELSWYGAGTTPAPLGGAFHSRRLKLVSSQVGQVSAGHRPRWPYRRRLEAALALLSDPVLDRLLTDEIAFEDASTRLPQVLAPGATGLAPVLRY
jgi:threonine dehydrogenase-like Zn-dependent dehydrogenase